MKPKIAINGFGRIGRLFFRQAYENGEVDIVAINDLGDIEALAYLLKYDTVYGRYGKSVETKGGSLVVDGNEIKVLQEKDPTALPWGDMEIDMVVEATGVFDSYSKAALHMEAGAKRVVITAPSKEADGPVASLGEEGESGIEGKTVLMGINEGELEKTVLTSNGSCTTNASSPVVKIMAEDPGIKKAFLNTIHGYTASQNLVDGPTRGSKLRRGRAAAQNIVPSTTGAAIAVTRALPELEGKFDGVAMRVPVIAGSVADITFVAGREVTPEEINDIFRKAAESPQWKGILGVTEDPIVSSDIIGEKYGSIVDLGFTRVVDGDLVKVLAWYDNEAGYVSTLVRHVEQISQYLK